MRINRRGRYIIGEYVFGNTLKELEEAVKKNISLPIYRLFDNDDGYIFNPEYGFNVYGFIAYKYAYLISDIMKYSEMVKQFVDTVDKSYNVDFELIIDRLVLENIKSEGNEMDGDMFGREWKVGDYKEYDIAAMVDGRILRTADITIPRKYSKRYNLVLTMNAL